MSNRQDDALERIRSLADELLRGSPSQHAMRSAAGLLQNAYLAANAREAAIASLQARLDAAEADAARYRWLCDNNFDRQETQVHTWLHTWEPHSQTGEPIEWKQRIRGGALDRVIDAARSAA